MAILTGLAIGSAALGLGSSIFGGISSAKKAREQRRLLAAQKAEEDAWYKRRYNEDYADSAAGQNLLRKAKDYAREHYKKAEGAAAVAGGTDAAVAMAKEQGNKVVADTLADMAAADVARKDNVDNMHRQAKNAFSQQEQQIKATEAANISAAASQASNALLSGAVAMASMPKVGNTVGGANLSGSGSNGGVVVEPKGTGAISNPTEVQQNNTISPSTYEVDGVLYDERTGKPIYG